MVPHPQPRRNNDMKNVIVMARLSKKPSELLMSIFFVICNKLKEIKEI